MCCVLWVVGVRVSVYLHESTQNEVCVCVGGGGGCEGLRVSAGEHS